MRLPTTIPAAIVAAVLGAACADTGAYYVNGTTGVYASAYTPDLVTVSPGVSVIVGYNEPIFYSNNYYWRYAGDRWYRSPYYNRGWVYATPPYAVSRIDRPWTYRNYRPYGYTSSRYRDGRYYDHRYNDRYRYDQRYRSDQRYRYDQQQRYRDQQSYRGDPRTKRDQRVYREQGTYSGQRYRDPNRNRNQRAPAQSSQRRDERSRNYRN